MKQQLVHLAILLAAMSPICRATAFRVDAADDRPWQKILGSVGITESSSERAEILTAGAESKADLSTAAESHIVIVEGAGPAAERLGILKKAQTVSARQICDVHGPNMQIIGRVLSMSPNTPYLIR